MGWLVDVDGGHVVVVGSMELDGLCEGSEICCWGCWWSSAWKAAVVVVQ